jgi:hypothetical protein
MKYLQALCRDKKTGARFSRVQIIISVFLLSLFTFRKVGAQCTPVGQGTTVNGVQVNISGNPTFHTNSWYSCEYITPVGSVWLPVQGPDFSYTYTFSTAVNTVRFIINGTTSFSSEFYRFTTNAGDPVLTESGFCYLTINGNQLTTFEDEGGGEFILSAPTGFTSMTISGKSLYAYFALCAESISPALPVTLVSFQAKQENQSVNLEWETTEETNSDRFEIEWKTTGEWNKIGSVPAAIESIGLRRYSFQHNRPVSGQNLYRLKMIDLAADRQNNTFAYSAIRNVDFESLRSNAVYPNPVTNGKLHLTDWTNVKVLELYNQKGQKVRSYVAGEKNKMDVFSLPDGLYVIKTISELGALVSDQIIINN